MDDEEYGGIRVDHGDHGAIRVTMQSWADQFNIEEVSREIARQEPIRRTFRHSDVMDEMWCGPGGVGASSRESKDTVQREVLFMDGFLAGVRFTVQVGTDGRFSGTVRRGGNALYAVEYRVEEVRLGFGDTVFLGFVPDSECPSWPQRVADALAFIEGESKAYANREREAENRRREAEDREFRRQEWERHRSYERQAAEAEAASHEKFLKVRRAQKQAQEARRRFQPPHIDQ